MSSFWLLLYRCCFGCWFVDVVVVLFVVLLLQCRCGCCIVVVLLLFCFCGCCIVVAVFMVVVVVV